MRIKGKELILPIFTLSALALFPVTAQAASNYEIITDPAFLASKLGGSYSDGKITFVGPTSLNNNSNGSSTTSMLHGVTIQNRNWYNIVVPSGSAYTSAHGGMKVDIEDFVIDWTLPFKVERYSDRNGSYDSSSTKIIADTTEGTLFTVDANGNIFPNWNRDYFVHSGEHRAYLYDETTDSCLKYTKNYSSESLANIKDLDKDHIYCVEIYTDSDPDSVYTDMVYSKTYFRVNPQASVTSKAEVAAITKPVFTDFSNLGLPQAVNVSYSNGETNKPCAVKWDSSTYNSMTTAPQVIKGTLQPEDGYQGEADLSITCQVNLIPAKITEIDNSYYVNVDYGTKTDNIMVPTQVNTSLDCYSGPYAVPVTYNLSSYNPVQVGEQIVQGDLNLAGLPLENNTGLKPHFKINVTQANATSIQLTTPIEASAFTSFNSLGLPSELEVQFTNSVTGTVEYINCPVTWNEEDYDKEDISGIQVIKGTISTPDGRLNTSNLQPTVTVKLSKAVLTSFEQPQTIEVEYGMPAAQLMLPPTIQSILPTGTIDIPVHYDVQNGYDPFKLGEQHISGTNNYAKDNVDFSNVTIPDLCIKVVPTNIVKVTTPKQVLNGKLGDLLTSIYPSNDTVEVLLGSGIQYTLKPNWDKDKYDYAARTQTLVGDLSHRPEGITNTNNVEAYMDIQLSPDVNGIDIVKVPSLNPIKVVVGSNMRNIPYLYRASFDMSNGTKRDIDIAYWDSSQVNISEVGTYYATASLLPDNYTNTKNLVLLQEIQVVEPTDQSISQIVRPQPIEVLTGEEVTLPDMIDVILSDGTPDKVAVTYKDKIIDTSIPGVIYIKGKPSGNNPNKLTYIQEIDIIDIQERRPYITEVVDGGTLYAPLGTDIKDIPVTNSVAVRLSDNRWIYVTPSFDTSTYDCNSLALQRFECDLMIGANYTNAHKFKALLNIQLYEENTIDERALDTVYNPSHVTVPYNTLYTQIALPNPLVKYVSGVVAPIRAPWVLNGYKPKNTSVQTFVSKLEDYVNPSSLTAELKVRVLPNPDDLDGSKTVVEIIPPDPVTATKGKLLPYATLPQTVLCIFKNGSSRDIPVIWDYNSQIITRDVRISGNIVLPDGLFEECGLGTSLEIISKTTSKIEDGTPFTKSKTDIDKENPTVETVVETPDVVVDNRDAELALIRATKKKIPYTLPKNVKLNWMSLIENIDTKLVTITPDLFKDEAIVDVTISTPNLRQTEKARVINPSEATAPVFTDVSAKHWAFKSIEDACARGYIHGVSGTTFGPKNYISVSDTLTFMDRILVANNKIKMIHTRDYIDTILKNKEHWAYYNVASILSKLDKGVIATLGLDNGDPYDIQLTREQVALILEDILTQYNIQSKALQLSFVDEANISYKQEVQYCVSLGLFYGDNTGHFLPDKKITRAELVSVLLRLDDLLAQ